MTTEQTALESMLPLLAQPAFYEENGTIQFWNHAAETYRIHANTPVASFLPEGFSLPVEKNTPVQLALQFGTSRTQASVLPYGAGHLFLLAPAETPSAQAQTLLSISQNIRTPLTSLFTVASSLFPALEEMEDPALQKQLASMNRAYYQLLRLACNLTDMRSVLLDELHLNREKVELTGFFQKVFDRAAPLLESAGYTLQFTCRAKPFCGWIDRQRLERVVWNLLSNAVKFTPRGGMIHAELEFTLPAAILRIRDNGEGMPPELLSSAFSGYARAYDLADARWGAGFGLPLSEHIVHLHGGSLLLESSPGAGTTATVSLSLRIPSQKELQFRSPTTQMDYTGGFTHELVELSNILPLCEFDSYGIN